MIWVWLTDCSLAVDFSRVLNAGFALVVDHGNGNYEGIAGEGALYDAVSRDGSDFVLEEPVQENLRLVQGAAIGKQQIYGLVSNLELYSRNVPYSVPIGHVRTIVQILL